MNISTRQQAILTNALSVLVANLNERENKILTTDPRFDGTPPDALEINHLRRILEVEFDPTRNEKGLHAPAPQVSGRLCKRFDDADIGYPVSLFKGEEGFSVVYGLKATEGLTYGEAAQELGESLMHSLATEGKLQSEDD